jgi:hypothetical protein
MALGAGNKELRKQKRVREKHCEDVICNAELPIEYGDEILGASVACSKGLKQRRMCVCAVLVLVLCAPVAFRHPSVQIFSPCRVMNMVAGSPADAIAGASRTKEANSAIKMAGKFMLRSRQNSEVAIEIAKCSNTSFKSAAAAARSEFAAASGIKSTRNKSTFITETLYK